MPALVLLTAHPQLYTPCRFGAEARRRGWKFVLCQPPDREARDRWRPELPRGAPFLARAGPFTLISVLRAHRMLTRAGHPPLQPRRALRRAADQWLTLTRLRSAGLPTPDSRLVRSPAALAAALAEVPGPPWFLKGRRGSQGTHVLLAEDSRQAAAITRRFWGLGLSVVVQEDRRRDGPPWRLLVAGDEVLAAAETTAAAGEFRTNWHRGGGFRAASPPAELADLARRATQALHLPLAGVDLLGASVLEVNASPGVEGLEAATGRNLTGDVLRTLSP